MSLREDIETLQNHGRVLKAIFSVADQIKDIEQIEQLAGEASGRLKAAQDEEAAVKARIDRANKDLVALNSSAVKAKATADEAKADAEAKAAQIVADANATATSIISDAKAAAAGLRSDAQAAVSTAQKAVDDKKSVLASLDSDIEAANQELKDVQAKIEVARSTIKQMIGA